MLKLLCSEVTRFGLALCFSILAVLDQRRLSILNNSSFICFLIHLSSGIKCHQQNLRWRMNALYMSGFTDSWVV